MSKSSEYYPPPQGQPSSYGQNQAGYSNNVNQYGPPPQNYQHYAPPPQMQYGGQYAAPHQQQPIYVQQQPTTASKYGPGSNSWAWCCGLLNLAICIEFLVAIIGIF